MYRSLATLRHQIDKLIEQATLTHIQILELKGSEFCGDSVDRECVRDLLISKYKLSFPN